VILMAGPDTRRIPEGDAAWYRYKPVTPDPKYPRYFSKSGDSFFARGGSASLLQGTFCKVLVIKPGTEVVEQDVVLERTTFLPVKVLDGAGKPVGSVWVAGMSPEEWHRPSRIAGDACGAYHLQPGKPRLMVFHEPTRKLFGTLRLKGDEKGPLVVRLGPGGAVKGRLVGPDGRPLAGVVVKLYHRERQAEEVNEHVHEATIVETDASGRFRLEGVVPGVKLDLWLRSGRRDFKLAEKLEGKETSPGKVLDLGDLKVKPDPPAE
jgi:hypothetical protein